MQTCFQKRLRGTRKGLGEGVEEVYRGPWPRWNPTFCAYATHKILKQKQSRKANVRLHYIKKYISSFLDWDRRFVFLKCGIKALLLQCHLSPLVIRPHKKKKNTRD